MYAGGGPGGNGGHNTPPLITRLWATGMGAGGGGDQGGVVPIAGSIGPDEVAVRWGTTPSGTCVLDAALCGATPAVLARRM